MYNNLGVQRYRETDINSMSSEKMIVLLYERIVADLEAARLAIEKGDQIEMTKQVNHSQRIIAELRGALDHSIGGEIAENLESLYSFLFHEHLEILLNRDVLYVDNCINVITPLLDAWRKIPTGTGDKAAQDQTRGLLGSEAGPDPASEKDEDQIGLPDNGETISRPIPRKTNLLSVSA